MHFAKKGAMWFGLVLCILCVGVSTPAQVGKAKFGVPTRLKLNGVGEPDPKEETHMALITASLYPLGWSRDGKFAYYLEPPDEECGCYFAELVIQDMRTDKVMWRKKYSSENLDQPDSMTLEKYWRSMRKLFEAKLNYYHIEPQKKFDLLFPSSKYNGDVLTPKIAVNITTDDVFEVNGTVVLKLHSDKKGAKTLYKKIYRKNETSGFRAAEVSGMLQSPFGPRVAVVVVETIRGWEGPPHITSLRIVGSDLTTGFRK